jgi:hypothetical protein
MKASRYLPGGFFVKWVMFMKFIVILSIAKNLLLHANSRTIPLRRCFVPQHDNVLKGYSFLLFTRFQRFLCHPAFQHFLAQIRIFDG